MIRFPMMKRIYFCLIILLGSSDQAFSQKSTEVRDQTWFGYLNQMRFTKRSGLWIDLQMRYTDHFIRQKSQSFLRFSYTYYLTDGVRLSAGYAYITNYGQNGTANLPEHQPWQQVQWLEKKKSFNITQWFRIEERFRRMATAGVFTEGYAFNWHFRCGIGLIFALRGKTLAPKTPFLFFGDELLINAGRQIVNNYFDQNRITVGFGYQITSRLNVQLSYVDSFQQLPAGNQYVNINAVRLFIFHSMDLRKKVTAERSPGYSPN